MTRWPTCGPRPEGMWLDWHEGDPMLQAWKWWDER